MKGKVKMGGKLKLRVASVLCLYQLIFRVMCLFPSLYDFLSAVRCYGWAPTSLDKKTHLLFCRRGVRRDVVYLYLPSLLCCGFVSLFLSVFFGGVLEWMSLAVSMCDLAMILLACCKDGCCVLILSFPMLFSIRVVLICMKIVLYW